MSTFEKVYQIDPSREASFAIEHTSIELSDDEYVRRAMKRVEGMQGLNRRVEVAQELEQLLTKNADLPTEKLIEEKRKKNAKSPRKIPKSKAKKDHRGANKAAVARIQEEL